MKNYPTHAIFSLLLLSLLAGCSSTFGRLSDTASSDPDTMLAEGRILNMRGAEMVERGQAEVLLGQQQVVRGLAQSEEASVLVAETRLEYMEAIRNAGRAVSPRAAEVDASRLKEIGTRWQDAIDNIRDGNSLIEQGQSAIEKAQSQIREGRILMEQGSTLVRNSERLRFGGELI